MIIRKIEVQDAINFIALNERLAIETDFLLPTPEEASASPESQKNAIQAMHEKQMQMVFVSEHNNNLLGFIGITRFPLKKMQHVAKFAMGVTQLHKRQGIGRKLIQTAELWLKNANITRLEMTVLHKNIEAISFYKNMGFEEEGLRKSSICIKNEFYDEIYMAKII